MTGDTGTRIGKNKNIATQTGAQDTRTKGGAEIHPSLGLTEAPFQTCLPCARKHLVNNYPPKHPLAKGHDA